MAELRREKKNILKELIVKWDKTPKPLVYTQYISGALCEEGHKPLGIWLRVFII